MTEWAVYFYTLKGTIMKSTTCFSRATGAPLSVYNTEAEAQQSADYQLRNGRRLYAYHCERCGLWHLAKMLKRLGVNVNQKVLGNCTYTNARMVADII